MSGLGGIAADATQAASPAWKLLGVTGPTHLPPRQSEIQRVAVEAEGGEFSLSQNTAEGEGTLGLAGGFAHLTENSNQAEVFFVTAGAFAVGQPVSGPGIPAGTTIIAVTGSVSEPVLELSNNATASEFFAQLSVVSKEVTGVSTSSGAFRAGDAISGTGIPAGTTVAAVGSGTLALSEFPTGGGTVALTGTETTSPIPYNAPASSVQSGLEALQVFGPADVSVSGGPGGDAEHPYVLEFGGSYANGNVSQLVGDGAALVGEHAEIHVVTTVPGGPGTGEVVIFPANIGGTATSGQATLELGPLPPGVVTAGPAAGTGWNCAGGAGESSVVCTTSSSVPATSAANQVVVPVEVESDEAGAVVSADIAGGAGGTATVDVPVVISSEPSPAGVQAFWAGVFDENGQPSTQAGAHPFSALTYFELNTVRSGTGAIVPAGTLRDVKLALPPGFVGDPRVTARCPQASVTPFKEIEEIVEGIGCGPQTAVGILDPNALSQSDAVTTFSVPIYNDEPPRGAAAEFSARIGTPGPVQSLLGSVRSDADFGVGISAPNTPANLTVFGTFAGLEGEPATSGGKAFLTNPTDCEEQARSNPVTGIEVDSWQRPGDFSGTLASQPAVTGCDKLEFSPTFNFQPSGTAPGIGVGATAHLHIPQEGLTDPSRLAAPDLKKAVVTLPPGLTLNPSSANGLEACTEAQIGYEGPGAMPNPTRFNENPPQCPTASELGAVEVSTPLLDEKLDGTIYLAAQEENPFHSLIALYLVVDDAKTGVVLKLPGEVKPDLSTGQLTATFDNNPQLPFEDLTLRFRGGGPRSELATPEICGSYKTTGALTPWSAPESGPPAQIEEAGFTVGDGCASSAATRPFAPSFEAGNIESSAGSYSPLVVKLARKDGEQELSRLDFILPEGVSGKLVGIPYCSEAAITAAEGRSGRAEQASPSCPLASQLGSVDTAAGVGPEPIHVAGKIYLSGPYKGAPVSSVVITPALAGPFDLGNVVVRAPLYVNPETTQITAKSDPIPTILKGIPLKLRSVVITIDRSQFTINPTSCEAKSVSARLTSSNDATATPSNRFQVGGCSKLKFNPKLKLSLKGGTKRNRYPSLKAVLTQKPGQANIGRVAVTLPHSEFLEQGHIKTICTRVQFNAMPRACPAKSIYGHAEAWSPLLDYKLSGPVYLRSSSNKLPDLVAALRGPASQPIEVDLDGRIDSVHGGIRNSFEVVPDAPVSRFVLHMQGGKKGLLVNSTNLCTAKANARRATVRIVGQNNKRADQFPVLANQCRKHKKKDKHHRKSGQHRSFDSKGKHTLESSLLRRLSVIW